MRIYTIIGTEPLDMDTYLLLSGNASIPNNCSDDLPILDTSDARIILAILAIFVDLYIIIQKRA